MEGELIYVAIIMQIGTLITIVVWSSLSLSKYFKKENFKTDLSNVRAQNKLNLKKMEKELGLTGKSSIPSSKDQKDHSPMDKLGQLSSFLPIIAKLDKDQLGALIDHFIEGGFDEDREEGDTIGGIVEFADEHPDIVKNFLAGLGSGNKTSETSKAANY